MILRGAITSVIAVLIGKFFLLDTNIAFKTTFFSVSVPAHISVIVLYFIAGCFGWSGWVYLREAQQILFQLEFNERINSNEIKAILRGTSISIISPFYLRSLCVITILSMNSTTVFHYILMFIKSTYFSPILIYGILIVPVIPFFLILINVRVRYFKPSNWDSMVWLFERITKNYMDKIYTDVYFSHPKINSISQEDTLDLFYEVLKYMPHAFSISLNTILRKYGGILLIIRLATNSTEIEYELDDYMWSAIKNKTSDILNQKFIEVNKETRESIKEELVVLLKFAVFP